MSLQHFGKGALRVAKNYTKGYSDVQAKVRDATSNDPWGPSGTQMNEIAQMTYNQNDFVEIMEMLDKRLNDKGKNWRHVFKSLTLLDYCLHAGSENVVIYFRDNIYVVKTLKEFQYIDEYGKDQGANVRQKAKDITNLLSDDTRLREERRSRAHMRDRMSNQGGEFGDDIDDDNHNMRIAQPPPPRRDGSGNGAGDDDLRRAIEESKRTAVSTMTAEERDIQEALRLSREEEEKRQKLAQDSTEAALFDDAHQSSSNGAPLIDTSFQAQFQGLQPQITSMQPQFTSFNPYQQQAQQEAMQQQWRQQQEEWFRQQQDLQAQQQAQLLLQQQQEEWARQQQQEEWARQQQQQQLLLQQQQLQAHSNNILPQPTSFGSNNPFALSVTPSIFSNQNQTQSLSPYQSSPASNFTLPGTFEPRTNTASPMSPVSSVAQSSIGAPSNGTPSNGPSRGPTRADQEHSHLASIFANVEDGVDTFGNYGQLRYGNAGNPFAKQNKQQSNPEQPFFAI